jgi:hypothetical protein
VRELLASVYTPFTEGFQTADLKEAKALVEHVFAVLENGGSGSSCAPSASSRRALILGREAFADDVWHSFRDICRRRCGPFFLDLGKQPDLQHCVGLLSRRIIMRKTARLEDYGAQFGEAAAASVVEMHERKAGAGHSILQERDYRSCRKAILAAQMEKSADQAMAAVAVIVAAARPAAVVGKKLKHEIEQLHCVYDIRFRHWFIAPDPG